jgi:HAD superfamily hydrolase (TIGR01509 family)
VLVIFDCDGVLVDSEPLSNQALVDTLAPLGLRLTVEQSMAEFMGRDRRHLHARVAELLGRPLPAAFDADYDRRRDAMFRAALRPVDGIEEALDAIDFPTCVASSADHAKLRLTLGLTGLYERFEGRIFSAFDVARGKPAPDLFLHAAERMRFEAGECVVVEDAPAGIEAARAAGMRALHYGVDFTDMRLLRDALVDEAQALEGQ